MTWLDKLKEGDTVIVQKSEQKAIGTVIRANLKSQVIIKCGSYERKYWKKNGEGVGTSDSIYLHRILEGTPEAIAEVKEKVLRSKLKEQITDIWNKKIGKLASYQLQELIDWFEEQ